MPHLKKAELIEGEVYVGSPVHSRRHSRPHLQIGWWLGSYMAATPGVDAGDNGSVRLDLDNEPQPDAFLLIEPERGGQARISEDDMVEGAPELVAEVSSSSVSYDLGKKLKVYRRNGVREYVVWRVRDRQIDWLVLRGRRYEPLARGGRWHFAQYRFSRTLARPGRVAARRPGDGIGRVAARLEFTRTRRIRRQLATSMRLADTRLGHATPAIAPLLRLADPRACRIMFTEWFGHTLGDMLMKCLIVFYNNGHWFGEEVTWKRSGSGSYRETSRIEIPQSKAEIQAFADENRYKIEWRGQIPADDRRERMSSRSARRRNESSRPRFSMSLSSSFRRQTIWHRLPAGSLKKAVLISSLSARVSVSKTMPLLLELGLLGGHVVDPERQVTNPALIDRRTFRPLDPGFRSPSRGHRPGSKPGGYFATFEDHVHSKRLDVEILERDRVVAIDREMLDSGHNVDSRFQKANQRFFRLFASVRMVFHWPSVTGWIGKPAPFAQQLHSGQSGNITQGWLSRAVDRSP